jgi:hypothetical protein
LGEEVASPNRGDLATEVVLQIASVEICEKVEVKEPESGGENKKVHNWHLFKWL